MNNKQHEFILKAFLESYIPKAIRLNAPDLICVDSAIGGYCTQLIKLSKCINISSNEIISKYNKYAFSELINHSTGADREELIIYYRLMILTETVLLQYNCNTEDASVC